MTTFNELLVALGNGHERPSGPSYAIKAALGRAYLARNRRGRACLLVELHRLPIPLPVGRVTGALSLTFATAITFELPTRSWAADCAIIECLDDNFLGVFCVLVLDLASRFDVALPAAHLVASALAEWERLFRCRRRLTEKEELGLWAELCLIARLPNVDLAVLGWRGPYGDLTDFFGGGVGIECKASRHRLRHHIGVAQAFRPRGEHPTYVVSMWVDVDDSRGRSLSQLVEQIEASTTEVVALEKGLLAAGYARSDSNLYSSKFVLLEEPHWFLETELPRVRVMDPGVLDVHYVIQLDDSSSLQPENVALIIDQFSSVQLAGSRSAQCER